MNFLLRKEFRDLMNTFENVIYQQIPSPKMDCSGIPVLLNDETMEERYEKVLGRMKEDRKSVV